MALLLLTEDPLVASLGPKCSSSNSDEHALVCIGDLHPGTIQYLKDCLFYVILALPVHSDKIGILLIPSIEQSHLLGPLKWTFSIMVPIFDKVLSEIQAPPTLMSF